MISVDFDKAQLERLKQSLADKADRLPVEVAIAINATAKKAKALVAKDVAKEITLTQKKIKRLITIPSKASKGKLGSSVRIKGTKPINLRHFKHRASKRNGVRFSVRKSDGMQVDPSAFVVGRYKGNVYRRVGKARGPLSNQRGVAVVDVITGGLNRLMEPEIKAELKKQIERRIRFNLLKSSGVI